MRVRGRDSLYWSGSNTDGIYRGSASWYSCSRLVQTVSEASRITFDLVSEYRATIESPVIYGNAFCARIIDKNESALKENFPGV